MKKRTIVLITLVFVAIIAVGAYLSPFDINEDQTNLAAFQLGHPARQADFTCLVTQNTDSIYIAIQELAESSLTDCGIFTGNEGLADLTRQIELLNVLIEGTAIETPRRGLLIESPNREATLPSYLLQQGMWDCDAILTHALASSARMTCENQPHNQRLVNTLLEFSEICNENNQFEMILELFLGMVPTRQSLSQSQLEFLEALEGFMEIANAPFWEDMYNNDPVITHIGLPIATSFIMRNPYFTIWLYDPDLIDLTPRQLATYTADLRREISEQIETETYRFEFKVNPCEERGQP